MVLFLETFILQHRWENFVRCIKCFNYDIENSFGYFIDFPDGQCCVTLLLLLERDLNTMSISLD